MKKKVLAIAGLVSYVVFLFWMNYRAMHNYEVRQRVVGLIRNTPANLFYPIFIGFIVLALGPTLWIIINQKKWSIMATRGSVQNAKRVASSLWRVDGDAKIIDDFPVVRFRHLSWGRTSFILPVRPGHPDVRKFATLHDGDTVEFEPLEQGMDCALEHELCGFIRIKSVSS